MVRWDINVSAYGATDQRYAMFTIADGTTQILRTQVAGATLGIRTPQTRDCYANFHDKMAK